MNIKMSLSSFISDAVLQFIFIGFATQPNNCETVIQLLISTGWLVYLKRPLTVQTYADHDNNRQVVEQSITAVEWLTDRHDSVTFEQITEQILYHRIVRLYASLVLPRRRKGQAMNDSIIVEGLQHNRDDLTEALVVSQGFVYPEHV